MVSGHWETCWGHANASALGTLVEWTTWFTVLVPLKTNDASTMRQAFARELLWALPAQLRRLLTYGQGARNARASSVFETSEDAGLFCESSLWEHGTNENTNGLLLQFFPKGSQVYSGLTYGDQTSAGDAQRSAPEDLQLAQSRTCLSPPVALGS